MKSGHTPIRTCIGCRKTRPAKEMIKLKASDGFLVVMEQKATLDGRGCYVCPTLECVEKARKKRKLQKALKSEFESMPSAESILNKGLEKKGCADDHHDR